MSDSTPQLEPVELDPAEVSRLLDSSHLVLVCYEASPAFALGIRAGWHLLWHADSPPADAAIVNAREGRRSSFIFIDDGGKQCLELVDAAWPFGMITVPVPGKRMSKSIASGNFDPDDLMNYWREGSVALFGDFERPLEEFMSFGLKGAFFKLMGKVAPPEKIAAETDHTLLLLLCLAKVANRAMDEARFYLKTVREDLAEIEAEGDGGVSTVHVALFNYLESVLAAHNGGPETALNFARNASELAGDVWEVERHLAELEGRKPEITPPEWTLEAFPIDYLLDVSDPIGAVQNNVDRISFSAVTDTLKDGELLAILVLGPYRANYFYCEDLERLALLNHAFPGRIREVHVIASGDFVHFDEHRQLAEASARRLALPFTILWDPNNWVAARVGSKGYPDRFLVDRHQIVMGRERLMHEEGFWKALNRIKSGRLKSAKPHL